MLSKPYVDQVAKASKPHVEKLKTTLKPYSEKVGHAYKKFLETTTLYHEQVFLLLIFSLLLNIPDFLFQLNIDA
jgi:hypothetical protein